MEPCFGAVGNIGSPHHPIPHREARAPSSPFVPRIGKAGSTIREVISRTGRPARLHRLPAVHRGPPLLWLAKVIHSDTQLRWKLMENDGDILPHGLVLGNFGATDSQLLFTKDEGLKLQGPQLTMKHATEELLHPSKAKSRHTAGC